MLANPSFVFNSVLCHAFCRFSSFSKTSVFARYGNAKLTINNETLIYLVPFYKATASKTIQLLFSHPLFSTNQCFYGGTTRQKGWYYETSMMVLRDIFGLTMMALRDSCKKLNYTLNSIFSSSPPQTLNTPVFPCANDSLNYFVKINHDEQPTSLPINRQTNRLTQKQTNKQHAN